VSFDRRPVSLRADCEWQLMFAQMIPRRTVLKRQAVAMFAMFGELREIGGELATHCVWPRET